MSAVCQLADDSSQKMSPDEVLRLRQIIDAPIDPNSLKSTQSIQFRAKDLAAMKLGDTDGRERNLRQWLLVSPDAKWGLWSHLMRTEGGNSETNKLGLELLEETKFPPSKVRLLAEMIFFAVDESKLKMAQDYLNLAENIVAADFPSIRRVGDTAFAIARSEMDLNRSKSVLLLRAGKWPEGIQAAKGAVANAKDVIRLEGLTTNLEAKAFSRLMVLASMVNLSTHQLVAGLYSDAEWTLRDTYKLVRAYGFNENQLNPFYNRVADLYSATGQYQEAYGFARRSEKLSLALGVKVGSPSWNFPQMRVTMALAGRDQWPQALANLKKMDEENKKYGAAIPSGNQGSLRGLIYLQNSLDVEALALLEEHLKRNILIYGESHYFTATARGLYAVALWRSGSSENTHQEFSKAMQNFMSPDSLTGDFVENTFQLKTRRFILQSYMQLLSKTAQDQASDAQIIFQLADQLGASSVQQAVSDAAVRAGVTVPGLAEIIRLEQDAKNETSNLNAYVNGQTGEDVRTRSNPAIEQMRLRIREIEVLRKGYKAEIKERYPAYFQLIQPKSPSPSDIARQLKTDELFVNILPVQDKTYVWAIDAAGNVQFHIANIGEKPLNTLVDRIRKTLDVAGLGGRAPAFDYANSNLLYRLFFSPIETSLKDKNHLVVATSSSLAKLPFAVLTRHSFAGSNPSTAPWLIKDLAVSHVPTANGWLALKQLGQSPSSAEPFIAWGDPTYDAKLVKPGAIENKLEIRSPPIQQLTGRNVLDPDNYVTYSKLPPLPETREEVLELARILSAVPATDVLLGDSATRKSVLGLSASGQLARKQVVVFATHGLLPGDLPTLNQPALAMASTADPNDSPLLTLEDVLSLKLNADWVVLSACNTAGADGRADEALTGLARGFFYAGSRSLLVTHWSVESESAAMLTTKTFSAYQKNKTLRRSDALRQAMLETMQTKTYSHPAYWAPYALVGEGGR